MVTPEIVMGLALLLFFLQLFGAHGSLAQLWIAHITFCLSYVAGVGPARAASLNPQPVWRALRGAGAADQPAAGGGGARPRGVGVGRLPRRAPADHPAGRHRRRAAGVL